MGKIVLITIAAILTGCQWLKPGKANKRSVAPAATEQAQTIVVSPDYEIEHEPGYAPVDESEFMKPWDFEPREDQQAALSPFVPIPKHHSLEEVRRRER